MAIEVMDQACKMAAQDPSEVASVFGSGMGDMQITDYMCRTLATAPRAVSPTKFHNSVHNASTGYWSIATGSHAATNAICAYANTVAASLLEGAIQAAEEDIPVLVAIEELAAPQPFKSVIGTDRPLAAALLLAPVGHVAAPVARLHLEVRPDPNGQAVTETTEGMTFPENFAADLLPLLAGIALHREELVSLPLSRRSTLDASLAFAELPQTAQA